MANAGEQAVAPYLPPIALCELRDRVEQSEQGRPKLGKPRRAHAVIELTRRHTGSGVTCANHAACPSNNSLGRIRLTRLPYLGQILP
jgi:hypothetical protein